jgi:hypothetical protein
MRAGRMCLPHVGLRTLPARRKTWCDVPSLNSRPEFHCFSKPRRAPLQTLGVLPTTHYPRCAHGYSSIGAFASRLGTGAMVCKVIWAGGKLYVSGIASQSRKG